MALEHVGALYKMASATGSKDWKEFLLSAKVLVPVAATVGVAATAGCIYYCWTKEKGKSVQPKKPKARPVDVVPVDPKPPVVNAKVDDKGATDVVAEKKQKVDATTAPAKETGKKEEAKVGTDDEKVCDVFVRVCVGVLFCPAKCIGIV